MSNISVKFRMKDVAELKDERGIDSGGRVQKFIDSEVMRLMEPYMQKDTGMMIKSMQTATEIGSGEVIVNTPYAHMRLHNGPTNALRGPNYFERMKADNVDEILDGAQKMAKNGGR